MPPNPARGGSRSPSITIRSVRSAHDVAAARELFREYRQWHIDHREENGLDERVLKVGLGYLDQEIESFPGEFAPPRGALVLALRDGSPVGCGALKPLRRTVGEIKRVYVRAPARGHGLGLRITRTLLSLARKRGYPRVVLDTLPSMTAAIAMYGKLGFVPTAAYWAHPVSNALYFEYRLP